MMSRVFFYGIKKFSKGRSHKTDFSGIYSREM